MNDFDLNRYMGRWFEIARTPNDFQAQCVSDVQAHYYALSPRIVLVTNRCRLANGSWTEMGGVATPTQVPGVLSVWFPGVPTSSEYRILDVVEPYPGGPYSYALVGSTSQDLWVLGRTPQVGAQVGLRFARRAEELGYAPDRLRFTRHEVSSAT